MCEWTGRQTCLIPVKSFYIFTLVASCRLSLRLCYFFIGQDVFSFLSPLFHLHPLSVISFILHSIALLPPLSFHPHPISRLCENFLSHHIDPPLCISSHPSLSPSPLSFPTIDLSLPPSPSLSLSLSFCLLLSGSAFVFLSVFRGLFWLLLLLTGLSLHDQLMHP